MVDGSNESLYYPDEELDPNLWKGTPLQKIFEKVDVGPKSLCERCYCISQFFGSPHTAAGLSLATHWREAIPHNLCGQEIN